ncbi:MAG TPA: riboflavin synthase [Candidatus Dormibacteraeota bacterium]
MFTGIVSAVGLVREADQDLAIAAPSIAERLDVGGSVSINGACLTAIAVAAPEFRVQAVDETRRRTNLGSLRAGDRVNLELPLTAGQRLDGHLVLGHVDATAAVREVRDVGLGREITVALPADLAGLAAEKGSIAIDGVSLTITGVDADRFTVALIPHTLEHTIAGEYRPGTVVNLEVDVLARYVERLVRVSIGKR